MAMCKDVPDSRSYSNYFIFIPTFQLCKSLIKPVVNSFA